MQPITDNEQFTWTIQDIDKKGQPIPGAPTFDAPPTVTIDNPLVADLVIGADGASITVVAKIPGTATVSVTASVGGSPLSGTDTLTVTNSAPAGLNLTAGEVSEQGGTAAPKQ
jgi:hypothetical protein